MIICNGYMPGKRQAARRVRGKLVKFQQNKRFSLRQRQSCEGPLFTNGQKTYRFSLSKNVFGRPGECRLPTASRTRRQARWIRKPCVSPRRAQSAGKTCSGGERRRSRHAKNARGEPIRHAERLRIRLFRHPALYILLPVCYICQQSGADVPPIIRREAAKKEGQTG